MKIDSKPATGHLANWFRRATVANKKMMRTRHPEANLLMRNRPTDSVWHCFRCDSSFLWLDSRFVLFQTHHNRHITRWNVCVCSLSLMNIDLAARACASIWPNFINQQIKKKKNTVCRIVLMCWEEGNVQCTLGTSPIAQFQLNPANFDCAHERIRFNFTTKKRQNQFSQKKRKNK